MQRRCTESASSQTPNFPAALLDVRPRAGDGKLQDLYGSYLRESLLL